MSPPPSPPSPPPPVNSSVIPCGTASKYDGGNAYPDEQTVVLGKDLGTVLMTFNAYDNPDAFQVRTRRQPCFMLIDTSQLSDVDFCAQVFFDGQLVIDTGYRGNDNPELGYQNLTETNIAVLGQPVPPVNKGNTTITSYINPAPSTECATPAGDILPPCPGYGTASFVKNSATTTVTVRVFAPNPGTAWAYQVDCPKP